MPKRPSSFISPLARGFAFVFALALPASASYVNTNNISGPLSGTGWNASAFNVVTLGVLSTNTYIPGYSLAGNFSTNSDTDGRVAVYGNLTQTGAPIGSDILTPYTDRYTLIVNGNSTSQNPYAVDGAAYVGGTGLTNPQPTSGTTQTGQSNLDFDFGAARTALENYSVNTLPAAATVNLTAAPVSSSCNGSGYSISLTGSGAVVANINSQYLTGSSNGLCINYTGGVTAVILNVVGGGTSLTTGQQLVINGQQLGINYGGIPVLFNFPTEESVTFNNTFTASILAPFATLSSNSNVSGTLLVGALNNTAETHNDYFSGTGIPAFTTATPEPVSMILFGSGLILLGTLHRRFRKR